MLTLHSFLACAVCMGDPGSNVSNAASNAIVFMIAIIGAVLSIIVGVIVNFALKQSRLP